jgi:hypothetical protein
VASIFSLDRRDRVNVRPVTRKESEQRRSLLFMLWFLAIYLHVLLASWEGLSDTYKSIGEGSKEQNSETKANQPY